MTASGVVDSFEVVFEDSFPSFRDFGYNLGDVSF